MEIWKPIPQYDGIYEASNLGRIRTCENKTTFSKLHGVRHWKQRILKQKTDKNGTGYRVELYKNGNHKTWLVHRLVASAFLGESDLTVNHIDGNRYNNNIDNLEWCSIKENIRKGFQTGLYDRTMKRIKIIRKDTKEEFIFISMTKAELFFNMSRGYIRNRINRGKNGNKKYEWEVF